jgi:hypothetical protein
MDELMKHLLDWELVEYYYRESPRMAQCQRHLEECSDCARAFAELTRDLQLVKAPELPLRDEKYSQSVWEAIRPSLPVYQKRNRAARWAHSAHWAHWWRPLTWTTACALLVAIAFSAGRHWESRQKSHLAATPDPEVRQRVVVVVLNDHLDRSERLLVELNHAQGDVFTESGPLQTQARELLANNRLIRQSAGDAGSPQLEAALDRLERLLAELVNQPGGIREADVKRLREQMNTEGLLFDIRVLRSRMEPYGNAHTTTKGASI